MPVAKHSPSPSSISTSNSRIVPGSSNSALHFVESFNNPYVKIILVCKICSKEMSLKFSSNWKKHYLTHSSNEDKPHKCQLCNKAFITLTSLRNHMTKKHDREDMMPTMIKSEPRNSMPSMINPEPRNSLPTMIAPEPRNNLPTMITPESRTNISSHVYQGGAYMKREHDDF